MDGHSKAEHFQSLVNQLSIVKMVIDDELQALLLLSSLPESWETLVGCLNNSTPKMRFYLSNMRSVITMQMTMSSVLLIRQPPTKLCRVWSYSLPIDL